MGKATTFAAADSNQLRSAVEFFLGLCLEYFDQSGQDTSRIDRAALDGTS
jgi:hypothetical protein